MGPGARQATPLFVSPGTVVHRARSRLGGRCSTFESAGIVLPTRGLSVHAFTSYCTWNFLRNSLWSAAPAIAWGVRRYKQLRGCTVHLRPLTPYLTTLTIRTVPYMMPAPLGPNHALDFMWHSGSGGTGFASRAPRRDGGRRGLPSHELHSLDPPRNGPASMGILGWPPSWGDQDVEVMVLQGSPHPTPRGSRPVTPHESIAGRVPTGGWGGFTSAQDR